jgi:hypothetical protein
MSLLNVNKIDPATGTGLELGSSGDTITIPSGATIANAGTATGFSSTISTPYCARMAKVANQTINNATWTLLDLASGTEVFDKGSIADLSTSKITVPSGAAGFWVFDFFLRVNDFRAARNIFQLYKNGSGTSGTVTGDNFEMGKWDSSGQYTSVFGHLVMDLAVSDYIQPYFYHNTGGSGDTIFERSFTAWYLGASS